jgi:hypothetical protein
MQSVLWCTLASDQDQSVRRYHWVCTIRYRWHRGYAPRLSGAHLARDDSWDYGGSTVGGGGSYRHCCGCRDGGDARDGVLLPDDVSGMRRAADYVMGGGAHRDLRGCAILNRGLHACAILNPGLS